MPTNLSKGTPYERLQDLGIALPSAPAPVANFIPAVRAGDLLFLSGQGPVAPGGIRHIGKVGATVSTKEAYDHARLTTINLLSVLHEALGSLDRVTHIVKVLGMVNAVADFKEHPLVINGCSDLLLAVFGPEIGAHARTAMGAGSLPGQITVEIELIAAVH